MEEQEQLRLEIEREKQAKEQAEALNAELKRMSLNLRHKALAYAINTAKQARKAEEARAEAAKLAQDVDKSAAEISAL